MKKLKEKNVVKSPKEKKRKMLYLSDESVINQQLYSTVGYSTAGISTGGIRCGDSARGGQPFGPWRKMRIAAFC